MAADVTYDPEADALMIRFSTAPGAAVEGEEVHLGVILHFDAADRIVGIAILHARKALAEGALAEMKQAAD
jgi:uncharacterized protein YuzE